MKNFYLTFGKILLVLFIMLSSMVVSAQSSISLQPNITGKCPGDLVLVPVYVTGSTVNTLSIYFDFDRTVLTDPRVVGQPLVKNVLAGWENFYVDWDYIPGTTEGVDFYYWDWNSDFNFTGQKLCDMVFVYNGGNTGTSPVHLRTAPDSYPTCIIGDYLGNEQLPYTFFNTTVSASTWITKPKVHAEVQDTS